VPIWSVKLVEKVWNPTPSLYEDCPVITKWLYGVIRKSPACRQAGSEIYSEISALVSTRRSASKSVKTRSSH